MYQVEQDPEIVRGLGVFMLFVCGFFSLWFGTVYLFGNTDKQRTPLQNFVRRVLAFLRWIKAVMAGLSCAVDAGVHGYYLAMSKPIPSPRSENVRVPQTLPSKQASEPETVRGSV